MAVSQFDPAEGFLPLKDGTSVKLDLSLGLLRSMILSPLGQTSRLEAVTLDDGI